ncbi:MAG TPA: hypothetical protein VFI95_24005 [Terriglobales bacterium]|nr:hypothetical protein [Terriglobales bacterium]
MRRFLVRNSVGFIVVPLLYFLVAPSGMCHVRQSSAGGQASPKESSQAAPLPVPVGLTKIATVQLSAASPSTVQAGAKCDSQGNIYAVWSDSSTPPMAWEEVIRKLAVKSGEIVPYRIPPIDGYKRQFTSSFNVGPDGALFILVRAQPGDTVLATKPRTYFVDKFDADGSFDSRVQLDGPSDDFDPHNFAVFADGRFLVLGMARSDAKSGSWRPFARIFNPDGRFATAVEFATDSKIKFPGMTRESGGETDAAAGSLLAVDLSSMTSDPNGNVYITLAGTPMQVIVVSASGEVQREITLKAPAVGLTSAESGVAESGFVYVHFSPLNGAPPTVPAGIIGVINVNTGQYDRLYELPADAEKHGMGVCGDSNGNFLFIESSPKNKLEIEKYSAN